MIREYSLFLEPACNCGLGTFLFERHGEALVSQLKGVVTAVQAHNTILLFPSWLFEHSCSQCNVYVGSEGRKTLSSLHSLTFSIFRNLQPQLFHENLNALNKMFLHKALILRVLCSILWTYNVSN